MPDGLPGGGIPGPMAAGLRQDRRQGGSAHRGRAARGRLRRPAPDERVLLPLWGGDAGLLPSARRPHPEGDALPPPAKRAARGSGGTVLSAADVDLAKTLTGVSEVLSADALRGEGLAALPGGMPALLFTPFRPPRAGRRAATKSSRPTVPSPPIPSTAACPGRRGSPSSSALAIPVRRSRTSRRPWMACAR